MPTGRSAAERDTRANRAGGGAGTAQPKLEQVREYLSVKGWVWGGQGMRDSRAHRGGGIGPRNDEAAGRPEQPGGQNTAKTQLSNRAVSMGKVGVSARQRGGQTCKAGERPKVHTTGLAQWGRAQVA